jgi:segregation and condensation protein A
MTETIPAEYQAKVYGSPLVDLPQDLYIPPDALEIFLDAFEGPLDLLLYLIRRNNIDILDIPMAPLTAQYMTYVEAMRANRLDLAAEYLVMAAWLIEIKSRMLLPKPQQAVEEELDPRAELVRRLVEYEQMKRAAQTLDELPQAERDFHAVSVWVPELAMARLPHVRPEDLLAAWQAVLERARVHQHHHVSRERLSVREHMSRILRLLNTRAHAFFHELFENSGVPEVVVTFLAMLELVRESMIEIAQTEPFAPIHVRLIGHE